MSMLHDFQKFIMRGNVVDMAVGVAIGTSFTAIVNSLVNDVITPFVGGLFGGADFSELAYEFNGSSITYGNFIQAMINFLLIALVVFLVIRSVIRLGESFGVDAEQMGLDGILPEQEEAEPEPKPEPEPAEEVVLLTEIRDLLKAQDDGRQ
jgi:large conductance mechanosensitive channel